MTQVGQIEYRITSDGDEITQAEALMRASFGAEYVQPRETSVIGVAVRDGRVVAAGYITGLVRCDSFTVDPGARGTGVSLGKLVGAADQYMRDYMTEHDIDRVGYFTFLADPSKAARLLELGYVQRPWLVFERIVERVVS